jgi:hypothetical protein
MVNSISVNRVFKLFNLSYLKKVTSLIIKALIKTKRVGRQVYYLKRQDQNGASYPTQTLMDIDV